MLPDDKRHGTYAGTIAHYKLHEKPCPPCALAGRRYCKQLKLSLHRGQRRLIPAIGYQRRIRALQALGYRFSTIADLLETTGGTLSNRVYRAEWVSATNHAQLVNLYDRLSMTPNPDPDARTLNNARKKGFAPPLAWDEDAIDNPKVRPARATDERHKHDVDPVVVERFLARDFTPGLWATLAEKKEIVRRWDGSLSELERLTGWKPERYNKKEAA